MRQEKEFRDKFNEMNLSKAPSWPFVKLCTVLVLPSHCHCRPYIIVAVMQQDFYFSYSYELSRTAQQNLADGFQAAKHASSAGQLCLV